MTDEEVVALFLRTQLAYANNNAREAAAGLSLYTATSIASGQYLAALDLLRRKWEQSLLYDDLLLRVARLEAKE